MTQAQWAQLASMAVPEEMPRTTAVPEEMPRTTLESQDPANCMICQYPLEGKEVECLECHHTYHTECVNDAMQAYPDQPRGMACALKYCKVKALKRSQGFAADITEEEAEEMLRGAIQ